MVSIPAKDKVKNMSKKNMRERCKETYRFLRSVDALYHWIGLGSLVVLLFKVAVLNCIPAPLHFMSESPRV